MDKKFPAATPLGYTAIFVTLWLWYSGYAGWIAINESQALVPIIMVLGGVVLAIAGLMSFFNSDKLEPVLFFIIAAYAFSYSIRMVMFPALPANTNPAAVDGWIHILLAIVIFSIWINSQGGASLRGLFLLALFLAEVAAAISNWSDSSIFTVIAGYLGLVSAVFAGLYCASSVKESKEPEPA
jgi:succinate-acetate transporter protein